MVQTKGEQHFSNTSEETPTNDLSQYKARNRQHWYSAPCDKSTLSETVINPPNHLRKHPGEGLPSGSSGPAKSLVYSSKCFSVTQGFCWHERRGQCHCTWDTNSLCWNLLTPAPYIPSPLLPCSIFLSAQPWFVFLKASELKAAGMMEICNFPTCSCDQGLCQIGLGICFGQT